MSRNSYYSKTKDLADVLGRSLPIKFPSGTKQYWMEQYNKLRKIKYDRDRKKSNKLYTLNWEATFDLEYNKDGKIVQRDLVKDGKVRVKSDLTNKQLKDIAEEQLFRIVDNYKSTPVNIRYKLSVNSMPIVSEKKAIDDIRRKPLNAIIYTLPNINTTEHQYTKDCMLKYFIEEANKSKRYTKKLDIKDFNYPNGMSIEQLEVECNKHNINSYGQLQDKTIVSKIVNPNPRAVLMFYVANDHVYPVEIKYRKNFVESIMNKRNEWKNDKKQTKQTIKNTKKPLSDIITQCLKNRDSNTNYIVPEINFNNVLEIMNDKKIMFRLDTNSSNGVNDLVIGTNKITYCDSIKESKQISKSFNIDFNGQSIAKLSSTIFKQFDLSMSAFNPNTLKILDNLDNRPVLFRYNEDTEIPANTKCVDIIKCYSSCAMDFQLFPLYSCLDDIEHYANDDIKVGLYYINTDNTFPMHGNSWYSHICTQNALNANIIKKEDIIYKFIPSRVISSKVFTDYYNCIKSKCNPDMCKLLMNYLIGTLNCTIGNKELNYTTNSREEAIKYCQLPNAKCRYNLEYNIYIVSTSVNVVDNYSHKLIYHQIVNNARWKVYNLHNLCENVLAVKTDAVYYTGEFHGQFGSNIGQYRKESIPCSFAHIPLRDYNIIPVDAEPKPIDFKWNTLTFDKDIKDIEYESFSLQARGGYGKSTLIESKYNDWDKLAFTNVASININGNTIHKYFKLKAEDKSINNILSYNDKKIVIDEISMVSPKLLNILCKIKMNCPDFKIITSGDFNQLSFIEETSKYESLYNNRRIENSYFFGYLSDFNKVVLTHCYRADKSLDNILTSGNYLNASSNDIDAKIHITVTNEKRHKINTEMNNSNDNKIVGRINSLDIKLNTPFIVKEKCKSLNLIKNELYTLVHYNKGVYTFKNFIDGIKTKSINMVDEKLIETNYLKVITIECIHDIMKYFDLGYAFTVNKVQGLSILKPYTINEWNHPCNDKYRQYTACSRAKYVHQFKIIN